MFTEVLSDSDEAYAATFLSLAVRYVRASGNWAWWEANKARIKEVAYRNLAVPTKRNGLISVFQALAKQTAIEKLFATNRGLVTINELGFYQRTRSVLAGTAAV